MTELHHDEDLSFMSLTSTPLLQPFSEFLGLPIEICQVVVEYVVSGAEVVKFEVLEAFNTSIL